MISFCEQILLMLNVLMISYLLFNKEFKKHHCVKGIICFLTSLVMVVLKKEINPSITNIAFMFLAYIFIFDLSLESIKEFIFSYIIMVFFQICINSFLSFYDINNLSFISALVSLILITLLCFITKRNHLIINNSILIILSSVCILLSAQLVLLTNLYISMNKSIKWNIILFLITSLLLMLLLYFCLKMNYEKKKRRHIKAESRNNHPAAAVISFFLYT